MMTDQDIFASVYGDSAESNSGGLMFSGTTGRSKTNNNPLNLEYRPGSYQDKYGAELEPVSKSGQQRFAKFPSMEAGYNAGIDQIKLDQQRGHTLASFVAKFAPPHENPTSDLVSSYAKQLGVSPDTPLANIPPEKLIVPMLARESSTRIVSGKPQQRVNPDASGMVADASGKATPTVTPNSDTALFNEIYGNPEKQQAINKVMPPQESLSTARPAPPVSGGTLQPRQAPDFNTLVNVATVDDPKVKFKFLAKHFFPNMDPKDAMKRFFIDGEGNMLYIDENDQTQRVIPDTFSGKTKNFLAGMVGRTPEMALSGIGEAVGGPVGAGLGASAGSIMRQQYAKSVLGDEAKGILGEGGEAVKEGVAGLGGSLLGRGITASINKAARGVSRTGQIGKLVANESGSFDPTAVQAAIDEGQRFGINLTAPEVVNSPTLRALWANLAKSPGEPAERISRFVEQVRIPQVQRAIQRELNIISPEDSIYQAGLAAKGAAKEMKTGLETAREQAAEPHYAMARGASVELQPVFDKIDELKGTVGPNTDQYNFLETVEKKLYDQPTIIPKTKTSPKQVIQNPLTDITQIHNAKTEIDAMFKDKDLTKAFDKKQQRMLMGIKETLLDKLGEASPDYEQGRQIFRQESRPLNELLHGNPDISIKDKAKAKTIISRLIDLPETNAENAHKIVFDNSSPDKIAAAKNWFESSGATDEWNGIVRARLQYKLNKVANETGNQGGMFRNKVFGNQTEKANLRAALDTDQFNRLGDFMDVLDKTKRIIYTNSETAFQLNTNETLRQNIGGWRGLVADSLKAYRVALGVINPKGAEDVLRTAWTPQQANKFLDAMLNDPKISTRLARIKQLPNNAKSLIETGSIFAAILKENDLDQPSNVPLQE